MEMVVECGTRFPSILKFDTDDFVEASINGASVEERQVAYELLHDTMNDITFIDDGCRNEDAVNSCIALHVLGYNPIEWFKEFFKQHNKDYKFSSIDVWKFEEHVNRVCKYIHRWGPTGYEGRALHFVIG